MLAKTQATTKPYSRRRQFAQHRQQDFIWEFSEPQRAQSVLRAEIDRPPAMGHMQPAHRRQGNCIWGLARHFHRHGTPWAGHPVRSGRSSARNHRATAL